MEFGLLRLSKWTWSRVAEAPDSMLSTLYRQHGADVYRLALRYGRGNAHWAEDITQDVFLKCFHSLESLNEYDDLGGWFYRVTTNHCLNQLRSERRADRWQSLLGNREATSSTPETEMRAKDELQALVEQVHTFPEKERVVFFMHHLDEKSQVEIAATLGLSKGYVSKLLRRAHERIEGGL